MDTKPDVASAVRVANDNMAVVQVEPTRPRFQFFHPNTNTITRPIEAGSSTTSTIPLATIRSPLILTNVSSITGKRSLSPVHDSIDYSYNGTLRNTPKREKLDNKVHENGNLIIANSNTVAAEADGEDDDTREMEFVFMQEELGKIIRIPQRRLELFLNNAVKSMKEQDPNDNLHYPVRFIWMYIGIIIFLILTCTVLTLFWAILL